MRLFAIDIGNSNIVVSMWGEGQWSGTARTVSKNNDGILAREKYREFFSEYIAQHTQIISQIIISSVVPDLTEIIKEIIESLIPLKVLVVDLDMKSPLHKVPSYELGQDLFANAVASYTKCNVIMKKSVIPNAKSNPVASITVDLGTALTFIAVSSQAEIVGVSIATGIESSFKALVGNTSQIDMHHLDLPTKVLGKNTRESLNSGIMLGYRHLIKGMVTQIKEELGEVSRVYATGGLSELMKSLAPPSDNIFDEINPYHTLDGLRILAEWNQGYA